MRFTNVLGYACLLLVISACAASSQATPSSTATQTLPTPTQVEEITFTLTLGGKHRDRGINLLQTRDGGYALIGYTSSLGAGQEDVYLVRTDSRGEVLWSKTYGGADEDNGWAILETEDGGFVIFGFTSSFGAGGSAKHRLGSRSVTSGWQPGSGSRQIAVAAWDSPNRRCGTSRAACASRSAAACHWASARQNGIRLRYPVRHGKSCSRNPPSDEGYSGRRTDPTADATSRAAAAPARWPPHPGDTSGSGRPGQPGRSGSRSSTPAAPRLR